MHAGEETPNDGNSEGTPMNEFSFSDEIIPHKLEGVCICQRVQDGYVNASAMCKAVDKSYGQYSSTEAGKEYALELSRSLRIPLDELVVHIGSGPNEARGYWVHPDIAVNLAQWCSAKFAVAVAQWVREWARRRSMESPALPYHLRRYVANSPRVPVGHWSMMTEMTLALIAPLEAQGYSLPERMLPDISQGRMFCGWLRKEHGVEPDDFPLYEHEFENGKIVAAKAYPDAWLPEFRKHLREVWMSTRMEDYFAERDPSALPYLKKLLSGPSNVVLLERKTPENGLAGNSLAAQTSVDSKAGEDYFRKIREALE